MCIALMGFAHSASAQWAVIDPSNLVQNIQQVVKSSATASNLIKSLNESVKIYEQGRRYYDALKTVSSVIRDARKVVKTIEMVSEITNIYVTGFNKMVTDPNFTPSELAAISTGYAKLLDEGGALIGDLKLIINSSSGLSMSDKERMDAVDAIYQQMLEYRNLTRYFTNRNISVSYIRSREKHNTERILSLYGSPSERYW